MLRFKNDDGSEFPEWEEHEIAELIQLYNEKVSSDCQLPILTSSKKNGIEYQEEHFTGKQRHDIEGYNVLPRNYCTYRNRSDGTDFTFNINKLCDKGIVSKFYPVFKEKDCDLFFLVSLLNNERKTVRKIAYTAKGTGQKVLSITDLRNITVNMPSLPEQQKIADFLSTIDTVIEKQKETVSAWEERKKGVMQKLFSQEVRFKADDGSEFPDWEEKKLGECGRFYTGVGFSEKYQGHKGLDVDVYKVSDMNIVGNEKYMTLSNNTVDDSIVRQMKTKVITSKCLVFAKVGAAIYGERKRITTKPFLIDNNMMAFEPYSCLNIEYLHSWSCSVKFSQYAQVGALPSYNSSDIGIIKIHIPCLAEQQKIADCLSSLDEVIEKQKATLAAWEELKKGLLQQMFV